MIYLYLLWFTNQKTHHYGLWAPPCNMFPEKGFEIAPRTPQVSAENLPDCVGFSVHSELGEVNGGNSAASGAESARE